ncbi:hypothetical protein [Parasitella parasitica]|uniref:BTB domain-containing protein n=1 Tax=Parasitella parasitica TaxID=35722 RepID=A0A0B7NFT8_9FUNG|nr:hypothetical protein [Parasitella parasitica]
MASIFKAIRDNDTQLVNYFIEVSLNERPPSNIPKKDREWIHYQLKITDQKLFDLNRRSSGGKTALHYAVTWNRLEIASHLISLPHVDVNMRDRENGWTALHRCLYFGNLEIARMLLKREDIDLHVKDWEGLEAFELYNLTIPNTLPIERVLKKDESRYSSDFHARKGGTDVYTWGQNANYVLGHPDTENRAKPERVRLQLESQSSPFILQRPSYLIETVAMSKYHLAILTTENSNNLLVCGFGSGGRLGTGKETDTQFTPTPVQWPERITSVALGRDHTIAVTEKGSVISFGNNSYGQLGYETDNHHSSNKEPMQLVPRKIQAQSLKKQPILGAAASKVHSVVYTATDIFTFGLNQGQLGYHQPDNERCQAVPRKVSMSTEITQVVANDNCTAILNASFQVILLCNYTQQKLFFPVDRFPSNITVHRSEPTCIVKLVASGTEHLGAVSNIGDVFLWTCRPFHSRNAIDSTSSGRNSKPIQPNAIISTPKRIWSPLNKPHFGAIDAGIGQHGEVIVCTLSGHVYKGTHEDKFSQIPHLQRCIRVCANSSGAYAAIRSEHLLSPLQDIAKSTLQHDLSTSLPHINASTELDTQLAVLIQAMTSECKLQTQKYKLLGSDVDQDDVSRQQHIIRQKYCQRLVSAVDHAWCRSEKSGVADRLLDVVFCVNGRSIYCHSAVLRCRSDIFNQLATCADRRSPSTMSGIAVRLEKRPEGRGIVIHVDHCQVAAILLLLEYIYTDEYQHPMNAFFKIPALCFVDIDSFTDRKSIHESASLIQRDLIALATVFELPHLLSSAQQSFSHTPMPSLTGDLKRMLDKAKNADISIQTAEKEPLDEYHQIILRQRCPYFANLLKPGSEWIRKRLADQKCIQVNLEHISKEAMDTFIRYIYTDEDKSTLFSSIQRDQEESMVQFLLAFLSEADFLLLGRLKAITEQVLVPFIKLRSAATILEHADLCLAESLKRACLEFISVNLPVFFGSGMLDFVADSLIQDLEAYVRQLQMNEIPFVSKRRENDAGLDTSQQQLLEENVEFSSSLYALSRGDGSAVTFNEVLYTVYPEKPSLVKQKPEQPPVVVEQPQFKQPTGSARMKRGTKVQLGDLESELGLIEAAASSQRRRSSAGWGTSITIAPEHAILETPTNPSLREIIETENQSTSASPKNQKSVILKKISQKERKRLAQQQESSAAAVESCSSSAKPVWGKVPTVQVKPTPKILSEMPDIGSNSSNKEPLSASDKKGKKIYVSGPLLEHEEYHHKTPSVDENRPLYSPLDSLGPSFRLTPIRRYTNTGSKDEKTASKSSFQSILKQQELEDHWRKNNKPKKSIALIQKEEQALAGIGQYYVQTLDIFSGEWFEIKRL